MNPTIRDIAKKTNVSTMTVSRVVNNSGYVSAATREKVEAAIRKLNYQPNLVARSLLNRKSSFVYVIVPDIANPFYAELTKGVETIARTIGYNLIVSSAHWDEKLECEQIEAALGRMAEAIILVLPKLSENRILEYKNRVPLVVVDRHLKGKSIDSIYIDQERGAKMAVDHLLDLGHRRIAFISGPARIYNSVARRRGYEKALVQHSIGVNPSYVFQGDFSFESGQKAFYDFRVLDSAIRPTAVFAASDLMALGFMRSAFVHGFRIPDEVSLVGFDDISLASITNPPLTTVRHPFIQMGEEAMKLIRAKISPDVDLAAQNDLQNSLQVRQTTSRIEQS